MKRIAVLVLAMLAAGCASLPTERFAACDAGPALDREVVRSRDGTRSSVRISVLTYNVEGLQWPARSGRRRPLDEIASRLSALREQGRAPDIILFQEVFSRAASRAVARIGYPNLVAGPHRSERRPPRNGPRLPGARRPERGELGLKLSSSGLVIVSDFPVVDRDSRPFPRGSCAGRDCLANKGMLYAEIRIPGVPLTLDLFNTHMNSQGASRVPERRHLASHHAQARALADYLAEMGDLSGPLIFGGDFNMRHSEERFSEFQRHQPRLSDHDGFLVTYELSWPTDLEARSCGSFGRPV